MQKKIRVGVIVGSLRAESYSKKMAKALIEQAPSSLECHFINISDLEMYNEDLDTMTPPASWVRLRKDLRATDAVLFVTPEYNRSVPGCLKNAIDVASRPYGQNVLDGMPAAVVSVSPSPLAAFGANHALRQTFVFLNMPVMQQPEAYVGKAKDLLDEDGKVKNKDTIEIFKRYMSSFETWIKVSRSAFNEQDIDELVEKRKQIASDYVNGKTESLDAILTEKNPATFFSPMGKIVQGAAAVMKDYDTGAKSFYEGGKTQLEVLQSQASGKLAFWTGVQKAQAKMSKDGKLVPMELRITEVFRYEDGGFKLIHRHADMPKESSP